MYWSPGSSRYLGRRKDRKLIYVWGRTEIITENILGRIKNSSNGNNRVDEIIVR